MTEVKYQPTPHDHKAFLDKAMKRKGFKEAYEGHVEEYALVRELQAARARKGPRLRS